MTGAIGWLDCTSGVSGDMLLGALTQLGAVDVADVIRRLHIDCAVEVRAVRRGPLAATFVDVTAGADQPHRRLADVLDLLAAADIAEDVRGRATAVFHRLAAAESRVHGVGADDIEFHEVGAVDALIDIVGACAGFAALALDRLVVGSVALGSGSVTTAHGTLPIPGPAVVELLRDTELLAHGSALPMELATPTGVALLAEWANATGPMPEMHVRGVGIGAGGRDIAEQPNVVRMLVGAAPPTSTTDDWHLVEANIDDLDPRLWPVVIQRLFAAGAADAWLTPIVMKKGRPAHTLSALVAAAALDAVIHTVFAESSTIGVRTTVVGKRELDRDWITVGVSGEQLRVKVARLAGRVINVSPEFADVERAAAALDQPVKTVLAAAIAAAHSALA